MKLNHKQKIRMARKMRTQSDIKKHVPIFQTERWIERSLRIQMRIKKRIEELMVKKNVVV